MSSIVLQFKDVTIGYPGKVPIPHINFAVREKEQIALTGENKTLIKCVMDAITGRSIVSHGQLSFDFFESIDCNQTTKHPSPYHYFSYLTYSHHFRSLTGVDDAYYQQRYNSQDAEKSATVKEYLSAIQPVAKNHFWTLEKIVDRLNLHHLLEEHLIKLSSGETKRTMFAAALLKNPVLLLLDNPFTGLDINTRNDMKELIREITHSGIQVILSVAPDEIPDCINKIIVFNEDNSYQISSKNAFHSASFFNSVEINKEELLSLLEVGKNLRFEKIVQMTDVVIRYDNQIILDNINWTIKQGERWQLSGSNGAGKTTLLSLINGDNPQAFANHIILFDRKKGSGESIWDIKKKIGFFSTELYQFFPLNTSCLSAVESGFYDTIGLYKPSNSSRSALSLRWMKLMNIGHLANKPLRNVQPDERRLCLLARAVVKNPTLLILDEPCQGMNNQHKLFFKKLVDAICNLTNITLIYVSHYDDEIPESVTHVFKIAKGKQVL